MTGKKYQTVLKLLAIAFVLGSVLINIKNIFTSCQVDAEYQVAMAYRMIKGDAMFSQMWEPHQTSAFFLAFFEWIFLKITGSTTGIMVYSNAVGVVCKTIVAFVVYGVFRKYGDKKAAFMVLLFALNTYPKDMVLPDFANQQIWFGLLLMCCLISYFANQSKKYLLVVGALFLCLQVLSYPSCVLVWGACMLLMWFYSERKLVDMGIFTGICGISGGAYLLYFMHGKPAQFLEYIYYIWSGDETHSIGMVERLLDFGEDIWMLILDLRFVLIVVAAAFVVTVLISRISKKKDAVFQIFQIAFLSFYILGYLINLPGEDVGTKYHFFMLYLFVELVAWYQKKYLNEVEKRIFLVGQAIGIGGFLATLLLSDLGLFSALPYLIPAMCTALLPVGKGFQAERGKEYCMVAPFLICAVMIFRNAVYINGWMDIPKNFKEDSIFGLTWTASYGPLKGIKNGDGAYVADVSYLEWQDMIREGDRVLILSYPTLPSTMYLYQNVDICAESVISTPTYSERLFDYWEQNPEKYPNVVLVRCYGNSPMVGEFNAVTKWMHEDFKSMQLVKGNYWRYYFVDRVVE